MPEETPEREQQTGEILADTRGTDGGVKTAAEKAQPGHDNNQGGASAAVASRQNEKEIKPDEEITDRHRTPDHKSIDTGTEESGAPASNLRRA